MSHLNIANRLGDSRTNQFANINKTDAPQREFPLGNNHITTANFGDLIPGFWTEARPRDKFELDCNILAKFLALIAPAYCKADITVDWFFVPTKLISPHSLEFISQSTLNTEAVAQHTQNAVFDVNASWLDTKITVTNSVGYAYPAGIPRVDTQYITKYLQSNNGTLINNVMYGLKYFQNDGKKHGWRSPSPYNADNIGYEDMNCYGNKYRVSRLLDYMGIPKCISTYKFVDDYFLGNMPQTVTDGKGIVALDLVNMTSFEEKQPVYNPVYLKLFGDDFFLPRSIYTETSNGSIIAHSLNLEHTQEKSTTLGDLYDVYVGMDFTGLNQKSNLQLNTTAFGTFIDCRPFMAYQKIYNDYFRDPVKQDEVRLYTDFVLFENNNNPVLNSIGYTLYPSASVYRRFINNIFSLRRRNYDKDWLNNALLSEQLVSQQNVNYQPFNSRFLNAAYKFSIKKALSGNKYFDWLANFMDTKGNDYLSNNVTYIGGSRFPISISETIQTSSTETNVSPQGNRSGNMNAWQNTNKHYFSAPDYGYIMCIVSMLPRISYFNGVPQRFRNLTLLSQDLPDFNNIGFQEVSSEEVRHTRGTSSSTVFGYLPFGYQHKFTPDMVTGDFSKSLYWWHQSPDLDNPELVDYGRLDITYDNIKEKIDTVFGSSAFKPFPNSADFPAVGLKQVNNNVMSENEFYNNIFAISTDGSGDHAQLTMDFYVKCSRAMSENEILVDDGLI